MCKHNSWWRKELVCVGERIYSNNSTNDRDQCKLLAKQIALSVNVLFFKVILIQMSFATLLRYTLHIWNKFTFLISKDYSLLMLLKYVRMKIRLYRGVQPCAMVNFFPYLGVMTHYVFFLYEGLIEGWTVQPLLWLWRKCRKASTAAISETHRP